MSAATYAEAMIIARMVLKSNGCDAAIWITPMTILRRPPTCLVYVPLRCADLNGRNEEFHRALQCICSALRAAGPVIGSWQMHFDVNKIRDAQAHTIAMSTKRLSEVCHYVDLPPASFSVTAERGKIPAINRGLALARERKADLFICVDNDVVFDRGSIRKLLEDYLSHGGSGVTCLKLPSLSPRSTHFQRVHSHFFEVAFALGIGPRRSTGSLYAIDPWAIPAFPPHCNEADYLDCLGVHQSSVVVRSPISANLSIEVQRRVRLWNDAASIGYRRFNDDEDFISRLLAKASLRYSVLRSERFVESKKMYLNVIRLLNSLVFQSTATRGVTR